jgi:hypothetical protein
VRGGARGCSFAWLLALGATWAVASRVLADERYPLVADAELSGWMGARDISSVVRGLDRGLDQLLFDRLLDLPALAGIPIRAGRLVLLDTPLAMLAIWTHHEVFGHGARGREFGLGPTFSIGVPPPYGFDPYATRTSWSSEAYERLGHTEQVLVMSEGQEAEALLERELIARSLAAGRWGRLTSAVILFRMLGDLSRLAGRGDWLEYQRLVRLQAAADPFVDPWPGFVRWALDPVVWYCLLDTLYQHLVRGEQAGPLPLIPLGRLGLLPRPAWRLAPWGQELGLEAWLVAPGWLAELSLLVGPRDGMPALGLLGWLGLDGLLDGFDPGLRIGLWAQPETDWAWTAAPRTGLRLGGLVEIELDIRLVEPIHLFGSLGYKSWGYLAGRPLSAGVFAQAGLLLVL